MNELKGIEKCIKESVAFSDWFGASYLIEMIKLHISARKSNLICAFCTLCVFKTFLKRRSVNHCYLLVRSHCILFFNFQCERKIAKKRNEAKNKRILSICSSPMQYRLIMHIQPLGQCARLSE